MIVTPQRSGILEIDPMQATITVQVKNNRKRNDPFRDPFGFFDSYQNIDEQLQSTNRKIEVLPLPNPPVDFSGAVGEFKTLMLQIKRKVKLMRLSIISLFFREVETCP